MRKRMLLLTVAAVLAGCVTSTKINSLETGMSREQVEKIMGKPVSISRQGSVTYMSYRLYEDKNNATLGISTPYFVRLVDGKVQAYGRTGDFDSAQPETIRQQVQTVGAGADDTYTRLLQLKDLKDKGLLTEAEFEAQRQQILNRK